MSLKEELLAAVAVAAAEKPKAVTIKGFPTFYVRGRSVGEVDEQKANEDEWVKAHSLTATAAMVLCDADGTMLFDPTNADDLIAIKQFFNLPFSRVQKILQTVNDDPEVPAGN
jgi:hypothetical protein